MYKEIQEEFIKQVIIRFENIYINKRKARTAYKRHIKIFERIKKNEVDKDMLLELLNNKNPEVRYVSASYLLALNYETKKALEKLEEISAKRYDTYELRTISSNAKMVIKTYLEQGYLKISK